MQATLAGDPELGAEPQPAVTHRRAELDHHVAFARETREQVLELDEDRRRQGAGVQAQA